VILAYCQPYFKNPGKMPQYTVEIPEFAKKEIFKVRDC
jgi:hypothetical protein